MLEKLPAVVASGFVLMFVAALIGNYLTFKSRVYNALVTGIIWGVLFVGLNYLYGEMNPPPLVTPEDLGIYAGGGVLLAFITDWIGNTFLFDRRFANAFLTSVIWAIAFAVIMYLWWGYYAVA
jgi:hypothetical protein